MALKEGSARLAMITTQFSTSRPKRCILSHARGVPVADLPRLLLDPRPFQGAAAVLDRHQAMADQSRTQLDQLLRGQP